MASQAADVSVTDLKKTFGKVMAVNEISFHAPSAKITTLLGPSGCGKTTTLRVIAGLEKPDSGIVKIGESIKVGNGTFVPPEKRDIGMVFQSYAIWPHMKVFDNIAFPLRMMKLPKNEINIRVRKVLDLVKLAGLQDRWATQLSGGQQQRVALARALVMEPKVLLLDEPLSNLDAKLREHMRVELKDLQRTLGITTIYVTHDQLEALALSDLVIVMDQGNIVGTGSAVDMYVRPPNRFIADFIGKSNFINGRLAKRENQELGEIETIHGTIQAMVAKELREGDKVVVCVRPEAITVSRGKPQDERNVIKGKVSTAVFVGEYYDLNINVGEDVLRCHAAYPGDLVEGQQAYLTLNPFRCVVLKT